MTKFNRLSYVLAASILASASASATILSGGLNVDNGYVAYLSTDDNTQGIQISSGNNWTSTYDFTNVNLNAGQDYFLHVYAYDQGWIAGFLGEFDLTGNDHTFANGQSNLTTNILDWDVSTTGWNNYADASSLGDNGSWPWGNRSGVSSSAEWIWSDDAYNDNQTYFTTAISASEVPEPGTLSLIGLGIAALGFARRKQS